MWSGNKCAMMRWLCVAVLCVSLFGWCAADIPAPKCCGGENLIVHRRCMNGDRVNLNCTLKYIIDPDIEGDDFTIGASDGALLVDDFKVHASDYCLTKFNASGSDVAIVCADEEVEGKWYSLRAICGFISVALILATFAVYCLVPTLRDLQGKCIMHGLIFLAVSLLNLGIVQTTYLTQFWCTFYSFFNYYCFMTTFFWLNVTSFHIWKTVVHPNILGTEKQWYFLYNVYGHGVPTLLLIILAIVEYVPGDHFKPKMGVETCWFSGLVETWAYFYGPLTFLLLINFVLFVWCVIKLYNDGKMTNDVKHKSLKFKVRLYLKLFIVMGLMWVFEVISAALDNVHVALDYLWIITDYINVLQGILIFLLLVVFRKRALRGLANRGFCGWSFPSTWKNLDDEETAAEEGETQLSNARI